MDRKWWQSYGSLKQWGCGTGRGIQLAPREEQYWRVREATLQQDNQLLKGNGVKSFRLQPVCCFYCEHWYSSVFLATVSCNFLLLVLLTLSMFMFSVDREAFISFEGQVASLTHQGLWSIIVLHPCHTHGVDAFYRAAPVNHQQYLLPLVQQPTSSQGIITLWSQQHVSTTSCFQHN